MGDEEAEAILPSLPQLRSLNISGCHLLTFQILKWLPPSLDFLDISDTEILTLTPEADWDGIALLLSSAAARDKSVKELRCGESDLPQFDLFLKYYHGASVEKLSLFESCVTSSDLVHLLSKTPNLTELNLGSRPEMILTPDASELDKNVFDVISQLTSLRELKLDGSVTSDECLVLLTSGPCRFSLRGVDLRECPNIGFESAHCLLEFFEGCSGRWSD